MEATGHTLSKCEARSRIAYVPVPPQMRHRTIDVTEIVQELVLQARRQIVGAENRGIDLRQKRFQPIVILTQRYRLCKQAHVIDRQFTGTEGNRRWNRNLLNSGNAHAVGWRSDERRVRKACVHKSRSRWSR